jgi:predicted MFS family arabinose efflux permease
MVVVFAGAWWALALLLLPSAIFCAPIISATADQLVRLTPASVRGAVLGSHASALTVGNALGAPLAGIVIDQSAPRYGFVGVGVAGLALALAALAVQRRRHSHERLQRDRDIAARRSVSAASADAQDAR